MLVWKVKDGTGRLFSLMGPIAGTKRERKTWRAIRRESVIVKKFYTFPVEGPNVHLNYQ